MLIDAGLCHDYQKGTEQTLLDRAWNLQKFGVLRILIQRGFTNLSGKVKYNFANIPFTVVLTLLRSSNDARKYLTKAIKKEESPEIYAEIVKPLSLQGNWKLIILEIEVVLFKNTQNRRVILYFLLKWQKKFLMLVC